MLLITIETLRYERNCLRKAREVPLIHKAKTIEGLTAEYPATGGTEWQGIQQLLRIP